MVIVFALELRRIFCPEFEDERQKLHLFGNTIFFGVLLLMLIVYISLRVRVVFYSFRFIVGSLPVRARAAPDQGSPDTKKLFRSGDEVQWQIDQCVDLLDLSLPFPGSGMFSSGGARCSDEDNSDGEISMAQIDNLTPSKLQDDETKK